MFKLSELAQINNGKCNAQDAKDNGVFPLYDRSTEVKKSDKYLFDCEAIIVPGEGANFIPRYYHGKFNLHQRCYCIHSFRNVNGKYLFYNILANKDYFKSVAVGSTVPSLRLNHFLDMPLTIHSYDQQLHIVDTIGSIDDLIDTNNKIIESLSAYCDKLFKKIDYIDFKSYELGELFDIKIGRTPPRVEKEWFNCEPSIKWISISDMCDKFKFIFKTKECLTIRAVSKFNVPIIPKDTLIMSFKLTVGRLGITTEDMLSNEAIAAFNTDNLVLRNYVLFYLSNFDFKSLGNTSSIANAINSKIIKTISIKVPSEIELTYFNDKASLLLDKILNISKQNNTLIKLKEMYLKKFFG